MVRPISTCWAISRGQHGQRVQRHGRDGRQRGLRRDRDEERQPTRSRIGTVRWLKVGMPENSASVRMKGQSSGFSHASNWASGEADHTTTLGMACRVRWM